jgi:lipid II:glycine glycyltransferase (peptidoglycan interpeptide bridge formation enzyme)
MSNKELYQKICIQKKSELPVFMQPWWLDVVCKDWDVAIAKKGEQLTGVWPYPVEKKLGVSLLRTPMLTPYLGPHVFYHNSVKESNHDSFEHDTVAELMKQLPEASVWHLAMSPGIKQAGLFKSYKLQPQVQQTFLLELTGDEQTLLANMKDTTRRNIRVAEGEIAITNAPKYLKELHKFQKNTLAQKGKTLGYSFKYLQKIMDACIANDAAALWVAKRGDNIQAIVMQVWDDTCSYYFMGGQNPETNSYRAMSLLLWHTIKEAKKRGNTAFDLEGSMDEGVERFFRNFGGNRALYIVLHKSKSILWNLKKLVRK